MKRFFYVLLVVFISISLTGCIEVFEYITVKDNKVNVTINLTLSKALIEMAQSMSEDTTDYEEMFDEDEIISNFSYGVKVKGIDTPSDYGFSVSASLDKKYMESLSYKDNPFLPIKKGSSYYMSFKDLSNNSDKEEVDPSENEIAESILSGYKYRLVISKTYIKSIKKVIVMLDDKTVDINFYDLGDAYLIDIPISVMMSDNGLLKIN